MTSSDHSCASARPSSDGVRAQTIYVPDPTGTEWIQAPHVTLCLRDHCIPGGDCFPEGTFLLRDDYEFVPIEQIKAGDRIWGRNKWTRVQAVAFKGRLTVDAVEMNNGSTMYLTKNHKVFVGQCRHGKGVECPTCGRQPVNRVVDYDRTTRVRDLQVGDTLLRPDRIDFGSLRPDPNRIDGGRPLRSPMEWVRK